VDQAALTSAERRLAAAMASQFGLGLSSMALDMTSFATDADTGSDRAPLAGHANPGNCNDVKVSPEVAGELVARYRALAAEDQDLTVVFDAGQNSAGNFAHLAGAGLQFAGSLPPSDYPDLLAIPARRLAVIEPGGSRG
jgi:hypothetical protein